MLGNGSDVRGNHVLVQLIPIHVMMIIVVKDCLYEDGGKLVDIQHRVLPIVDNIPEYISNLRLNVLSQQSWLK
jgi:hypothetical protein